MGGGQALSACEGPSSESTKGRIAVPWTRLTSSRDITNPFLLFQSREMGRST